MSMTKREKILISIVLILAVVVVYWMYLLQPRLKELNDIKDANEIKATSVSANEQMQLNVALIDKGISDDKEQIAKYGESVLSDFDQPAVLVYLRDVVSEHGNKLTIMFEAASDTGEVSVNRVIVTMNTTYEGLKQIIKALDEGGYYLKITGINASVIIPDEALAAQTTEGATQTTAPADQTAGSPSQDPVPAETPSATAAPELPDDSLNVTMTLEFYNFGGEIPPDKEYPFTEGYSYGGDIFY